MLRKPPVKNQCGERLKTNAMLLFWNALIVDGEGGEVGRWESGEIVRG